eukprot:c45378_g1_i1.p1 GENE.c45378_g1_i1~~c45378_g1_i1.p1  ORF type:complete len:493 (+),score=110.93 c45378_g1_i1:30-1508(+)
MSSLFDSSPQEDSVVVPKSTSFFTRFLAFSGPGLLACIAYLDPGNFVAALGVGSEGGYSLLWSLFYACLLAAGFQLLAARIGVVSGHGLATLCRHAFPKWLSNILWVLVELAIITADIQAVIGSAIGFYLLFGIPVWVGCLLTALDTFVVLLVFGRGIQQLERLFMVLVGIMATVFLIQFFASGPNAGELIEGMIVPSLKKEQWSLVAGMLGAVIMTHNLFLHSHLVLTRRIDRSESTVVDEALLFFSLEFGVAMTVAYIVNASIVSVFAAKFYPPKSTDEDVGLESAGDALSNMMGPYARYLWGIGILSAGQAATMTGTYSGQIVMEGFLDLRISPVIRMVVTRSVALIPSLIVSIWFTTDDLNELDKTVNIMQAFILPFAVVPLIRFLSSRQIMGDYAASKPVTVILSLIALLILSTNFVTAVSFDPTLSGSTLAIIGNLLLYTLLIALVCLLLYVATVQLREVPKRVAEAETDPLLEGKDSGHVSKNPQ